MIGKIKISKSKTFTPMCAYVGGEDKEAEVLATRGVRDTSFVHMAEDFDAQRELNPDLGRAVMHVALAWPAEEKAMSNELMRELTLAWMEKMGIDAEKTQWSLTRHNGTDHPHGHLIINRVSNDGTTISDQKNFGKSVEACRKLEKQYGLVSAQEAGQDTRRAKQEKLPARDAAKLYVQDALSRHLPLAASTEELVAAMQRNGIGVQATYQGKKGQEKLQAVVFEYEGKFLKGSELGRAYSGNKLTETINEQRDSVLTQRAALNVAVQQVGQFGAELEAFGQAYGAQRQADEKAAQQAQAQKDAKWAADMQELRDKRAAERAQAERDEKAAKQAAPPAEKPEKSANQPLDPRLRPGYEAPTIKKDGGIER